MLLTAYEFGPNQRAVSPIASTPASSSGEGKSRRFIRNFNVYLEGRDCAGAIHLHLHLVRVERHVPCDHCENFLPEPIYEIGRLFRRTALVSEQYLEPFTRNRRRTGFRTKNLRRFMPLSARAIYRGSPSSAC